MGRLKKDSPEFREHLKNIASSGGKALVAKYGIEHMSEIGKLGYKAYKDKYKVAPVLTGKWAVVDRETNQIETIF